MNETYLQPADLFFTQGDAWLSRAIRSMSRPFWSKEPKPLVNHVGGCTKGGRLIGRAGEEAEVLEALRHVVRHTLWSQYGNATDRIEIWRPLNLTDEQKKIIVDAALEFEGYTYGWSKIFLQVLDYPFGKKPVFRRLGRIDKLPYCSYIWAEAYSKAGLNFGVKPYAAQPDDMHDFCRNNPDKYELIRPLLKL